MEQYHREKGLRSQHGMVRTSPRAHNAPANRCESATGLALGGYPSVSLVSAYPFLLEQS